MAVTTEKIRNICFLGHGGSGKTSLAEAMLFLTKSIDRMGAGALDFDPEESKRGFSIFDSTASLLWKDTKVNIVDTPGTLDFAGEPKTALRVADAAVITVDFKSGVQVGTELAWENAQAAGLPKAIFVNKCDDPDGKLDLLMDGLKETFGASICPVIIPAGGGSFIDLIKLKKYSFDDKGNASESAADASGVSAYRDELMEAVAGTDEELMMKYFDGEELSEEEVATALNKGISDGSITPVYFGAATKLWGVKILMDSIVGSFPTPTSRKEITPDGEPAIFVYKTTVDQFGRTSYFKVMSGTLNNTLSLKNEATDATEKFAHFYTACGKKTTEVTELACGDLGCVTKLSNTNTGDSLSVSGSAVYDRTVYPEPFYTMAISPKTKGEEDKLAQAIAKILDEDKTVKFENNAETKQLLLSTLGNMHLDVVISRMKSRGCPDVNITEPRIAYRETIKGKSDVEGKHKKQSGGHGQYGHVKMRFAPGEDEGLTFTTSVVGGSVPKNYYPAVEKGLLEAMQKGVLAGYPVVNLAADLYDGSYHEVDSNELSFKVAASLAYKAGLPLAKPVLLEPIGELKVIIPDAQVGGVMGDINSKRRGMVLGSGPAEGKPGYTQIDAEVPKAEMTSYTIDLRAMTQGKGSYTFYFIRYDEAPGNVAEKVIKEAKARMEEEEK